jgi:hypothetical protein
MARDFVDGHGGIRRLHEGCAVPIVERFGVRGHPE